MVLQCLVTLIVFLSLYTASAPALARFVQIRWRGEQMVLFPVFWTALEFCRSYAPFNGFPWSNVAMSQWLFDRRTGQMQPVKEPGRGAPSTVI